MAQSAYGRHVVQLSKLIVLQATGTFGKGLEHSANRKLGRGNVHEVVHLELCSQKTKKI